ncbi:MAG TPA: putative molybdenum carrier protein [Vicinamibacteria bacterium]|nr:putative molybdenum carrier protein [Vicinamibacteria bacterium]
MLSVVSGGQTGVDRGALDAARSAGLPCGGWCPRGRKAEDGPIDAGYALGETPSADYAQRTVWNVRDSDGTLVLTRGRPRGGTALTVEAAGKLGRPLLVLDLAKDPAPEDVLLWIEAEGITVLNVAGPRESQRPGIGDEARAFLELLFRLTSTGGRGRGGSGRGSPRASA